MKSVNNNGKEFGVGVGGIVIGSVGGASNDGVIGTKPFKETESLVTVGMGPVVAAFKDWSSLGLLIFKETKTLAWTNRLIREQIPN